MSEHPIIELRDVSKSFPGVQALKDVAIRVSSGEVLCLLGDNGAGKSTLIKIMSGVHQPSAGEILIDGTRTRLRDPRDARDRGIATVHQHGGTIPLMGVARNFFVGAEPMKGFGPFRRIDTELANRVALQRIREIGITRVKHGDQLVGTLSGGERQALAIARAMHFGARVLILDEPTSALGVKEAATVLRLISHARSRGLGIVFITHNAHHAMTVGDRFSVLIHGKVASDFRRGEKRREEVLNLMAGGEEMESLESELEEAGEFNLRLVPRARPQESTAEPHPHARRNGNVNYIESNGLTLAYDTFGSSADPPVVLIQGLGAQLIGWHPAFCEALAEQGYFVVRFDNRDCGQSTWCEGVAYGLADMADDVAGLITGLALGSAHVVGQSMGGMIAQSLVIRHPELVRSLALIYTTPSAAHVNIDPDYRAARTAAAAITRDEAIARHVENERWCASRDYPFDEPWIRELGGLSFDRGYNPAGIKRQLEGLEAQEDRSALLRDVRAPTVVLHGDSDRLIDVEGARALAAAMPNAELIVFEGMGHELPAALWPTIVDALVANARRGERALRQPTAG